MADNLTDKLVFFYYRKEAVEEAIATEEKKSLPKKPEHSPEEEFEFESDCDFYEKWIALAGQKEERKKLQDIFSSGLYHCYSLNGILIALSAPDGEFVVFSPGGNPQPYDAKKLYQHQPLVHMEFESFLISLGYLRGASVDSDNQGDYFLNEDACEKITAKDLCEIIRSQHVERVSLMLEIIK